MLHHSQLPKNLWGEAIQLIVWLKNRTSIRALGKTTPYEQLYGQNPILEECPSGGNVYGSRTRAQNSMDALQKRDG